MRAPVERHVLDEMREPLLVVSFLHRSRFDCQTQRDAFFGPRVLAHEKLQAVRERRGTNGTVERNGILKLDLRRGLGGCGLIGVNRNESRRSTQQRKDQAQADRPDPT